MKNILMIESSHNHESTGSRYISGKILSQLKTKYPSVNIIVRDLTKEAPPHLSATTLAAFYTPSEKRTDEFNAAVKLSDQLTDEVLNSDLIVISVPLWNFSVPSSVKAWIDHVVRSGKTFSYSPNGPVGGLKHTKGIIVASAGGVYSDGPMKAMDFMVPYLQSVMNFIGITDVQIVRVEGTKVPQIQDNAVKKAEQAVASLRI